MSATWYPFVTFSLHRWIRLWQTSWLQEDWLVSPQCGACPDFPSPARSVLSNSSSILPGWHFNVARFQRSTEATMFEGFIEQLLEHCGRWPEPKSVLAMDNASFHYTERIRELCSNAGVKLLYLPPYSPNLNLIEVFFAELKAFIRRNWQKRTCQDFKDLLEWSLDIVGARVSAHNVISDMRTSRLQSIENRYTICCRVKQPCI